MGDCTGLRGPTSRLSRTETRHERESNPLVRPKLVEGPSKLHGPSNDSSDQSGAAMDRPVGQTASRQQPSHNGRFLQTSLA